MPRHSASPANSAANGAGSPSLRAWAAARSSSIIGSSMPVRLRSFLVAGSPLVELLYFEGCPNYGSTRDLVVRVAAEERVTPDVRLVLVPSPDAAEEMRFLGSPTVRVNGHDVEPGADERDRFQFACRVYRTEAGLSGQPDPGWIRSALASL